MPHDDLDPGPDGLSAKTGEANVGIALDLLAQGPEGPVWGIAVADLNATLLAWSPGAEVAEHVNDERDVLIVVAEGGGTVWLNGCAQPLYALQAIVIPRGCSRRVVAGAKGLRYLSVHLRRPPLQISVG